MKLKSLYKLNKSLQHLEKLSQIDINKIDDYTILEMLEIKQELKDNIKKIIKEMRDIIKEVY